MKLFFRTTINAHGKNCDPRQIEWANTAETYLPPNDRAQQVEADATLYHPTESARISANSVYTDSLTELRTTIATRSDQYDPNGLQKPMNTRRVFKITSESIQPQSSSLALFSLARDSGPVTTGFPKLNTLSGTTESTTSESYPPLHLVYSGTYETAESHLLSSDTATALPAEPANTTATAAPQTHMSQAHGTRKVVLACVLGGVLGLVGCSIIGYCLFNLSGWYKNHKKRRQPQRVLSPNLSPLEKMDSDDPLVRLDNSIEIRRGSTLFISSPLDGENILRLKGPAPLIPPRDPRRMRVPIHQEQRGFYQFQPRPEVREPRPAPPPPIHMSRAFRSSSGVITRTESPSNAQINEYALAVNSGDRLSAYSNIPHASLDLEPNVHAHRSSQHQAGNSSSSMSIPIEANQQESNFSINLFHDGEYRNSASSSCYSNEEDNKTVSARADLELNITHTSQSSFNNAMKMFTIESETDLETVQTSSKTKQRKEDSYSLINKTASRKRQSPQLEVDSTSELYDDGEGAYPVDLLKVGEDIGSFPDVNAYYENIMGAITLENLDLFTEP